MWSACAYAIALLPRGVIATSAIARWKRDMRFSVLLVGAVAFLTPAMPVSRAIADDAAPCDKAIGEEAIAACTRASV